MRARDRNTALCADDFFLIDASASYAIRRGRQYIRTYYVLCYLRLCKCDPGSVIQCTSRQHFCQQLTSVRCTNRIIIQLFWPPPRHFTKTEKWPWVVVVNVCLQAWQYGFSPKLSKLKER